MLSRFLSNIAVLVCTAALVTLSIALSPAVVTWLGVGIGFTVVAVTAVAFLARDRGAVQRALDAPVAILGGWMIVGSRTFAGPTVRWLTFSEAVVLAGLAVVGLVAHEALAERAVHRMFGDSQTAGDLVLHRRRVALPDSQEPVR